MAASRVLLVDDEPGVLDVCARSLRRRGFDVITASDARTARILLEAQAVDLLITDIRMPQESGISLLHAVHQVDPDLPLMIMTGYPDSFAVDAALNLNVRSFIVKPFDLSDFVSEVSRCLDLEEPQAAEHRSMDLSGIIAPILDELRHHKIPILEGSIQRDPMDGRIVLVPGESSGAVPIDEFLQQYTGGKPVYLIVLPHG